MIHLIRVSASFYFLHKTQHIFQPLFSQVFRHIYDEHISGQTGTWIMSQQL